MTKKGQGFGKHGLWRRINRRVNGVVVYGQEEKAEESCVRAFTFLKGCCKEKRESTSPCALCWGQGGMGLKWGKGNASQMLWKENSEAVSKRAVVSQVKRRRRRNYGLHVVMQGTESCKGNYQLAVGKVNCYGPILRKLLFCWEPPTKPGRNFAVVWQLPTYW